MPLIRFFTSLGMVGCAYLVYAVVAVPLIEPAVVARDTESSGGGPRLPDAETPDYLSELFPEGAWERSGAKEIESGDAVLLFQDYAFLDDGRLELKPCTIIYKTISGGGPRRFVLQAPAGAELQFEGDLDLTGSRMGRLVSGLLRGEILISSPESRAGAADSLQIETRFVQIHRNRIWTPHEVKFQYGRNFGAGRDLVIRTDAPEARANPAEAGHAPQQPFGNVRSLELVHLDRLRLWLPAGRFLDTPPATERRNAVDEDVSPVDVSCSGPFLFDFPRGAATFSENVQLIRVGLDGTRDELRCATLELTFSRPAGSAGPDNAMGPMKVRRIEATGAPVIVEARSMDVAAECERLIADAETRRIRLEGSRPVWARHAFDYVEAAQLEYEVAEDPQRLGRFWSTGPGTYVGRRDEHEIHARWNRDVHLQKQDGQHILSIVGGGRGEVVGQGWMEADQLFVWLEEVPEPAPARSGTTGDAKPKYTARPVKMLADGNVRADWPQLAAATGRLEAWFRYLPAQNPTASPATGPQPARTPPTDRNTAATPPRVGVAGDLVRLQIAYVGEEATIEEATIDGHAEMRQLSATDDGRPLTVAGDQMKLAMDAAGKAAVDVVGRPARAQGRGMSIEGDGIHVIQRDNRMWIAGPGKMMLPGSSDAPAEIEPAFPIFVDWQGGMAFDGRVATFDREVVVRGKRPLADGDLLDFIIRGPRLNATMTHPVRLDEPGSGPKSRAELSTLGFPGQVFAQNQTYDAMGVQVSHDEMNLRDLVINQQTGELRAEGPGWLTSVRYEDDRVTARGPGLALPVAPSGSARQLIYLRVAYRSHLTGNHQLREVQFHQVDQVVYGPVPSWTSQLDPSRRDGLGPAGVLMTCDKLSVASMGNGRQQSVEMNAIGNVSVEGQSFAATAGRLSYNRAKDQLLLESDGRNNVLLEYQRAIGAMREKLSARQVIYWPGRGDVRVVDGESVNLIGR